MEELNPTVLDRRWKHGVRNLQQAEDMIRLFKSGMTLQEVGNQYGVTRQRVEQILRKGNIGGDEGGRTLKMMIVGSAKLEAKKAKTDNKRRKWETLLNTPWDVLCSINGSAPTWHRRGKKPLARYLNQMRNAKTRGIGWEISFEDWWKIWQESGKWDKCGRGKGYCMSRYGDDGPYSVENVYITTIGQNFSDSYLVKSANSRTLKRGPGSKGYLQSGKWFYVYIARQQPGNEKAISKHKSARAARRAYLRAWHERYGSNERKEVKALKA